MKQYTFVKHKQKFWDTLQKERSQYDDNITHSTFLEKLGLNIHKLSNPLHSTFVTVNDNDMMLQSDKQDLQHVTMKVMHFSLATINIGKIMSYHIYIYKLINQSNNSADGKVFEGK